MLFDLRIQESLCSLTRENEKFEAKICLAFVRFLQLISKCFRSILNLVRLSAKGCFTGAYLVHFKNLA